MPHLPKRPRKQINRINGDNSDLLNEYEAAEYLEISVHWLRQSRTKNPKWAGPVFVKRDGYHVGYRRNDLDKVLKKRAKCIRVIDPAVRMAAAS